jgi:hypothetical protein
MEGMNWYQVQYKYLSTLASYEVVSTLPLSSIEDMFSKGRLGSLDCLNQALNKIEQCVISFNIMGWKLRTIIRAYQQTSATNRRSWFVACC